VSLELDLLVVEIHGRQTVSPPSILLLVLLAAIIIAAAFVLAALQHRAGGAVNAYRTRKPLSEPEQVLYWRLREAMPECVVLCQVSFSRFLDGASAPTSSERWRSFARIAQKSVDFLVCLPDFTIVAAVELDDTTHSREKDIQRDAIFKSAGLPLIRLNVRQMPSSQELRALFSTG